MYKGKIKQITLKKLITLFCFGFFARKKIEINKVFLCHDRIYEYKDVAEILSHELVHAFDYCRANIDIENNRHVACSEVWHTTTLYYLIFSLSLSN